MQFEWWMAVVGLALVFDFFNGVNDAANSVATVIATRVLTPVQAVAVAAVMNFLGPFVFGLAVAATVGKGIIETDIVTTGLIAAAVGGGIVATAGATWFGMPISVSHSLVGGLIGAGAAAGGWGAVNLPSRPELIVIVEWVLLGAVAGAAVLFVGAVVAGGSRFGPPIVTGLVAGATIGIIWGIASGVVEMGGLTKTLVFIVFSPIIGFLGAFVLGAVVIRISHRADPKRANWWFRRLQLVSVSLFSLSHGTNDAQKTMGIIAVLLLANGVIGEFYVPTWVIISAASAIALGTLIGGFKVVRTLAHKLTHLQPHQGFTAETAGAGLLFGMAHLGVPVSTTHSITGAIMGIGATKSVTAVRWGVARNIVAAWVLTIPVSATVAYLLQKALFVLT